MVEVYRVLKQNGVLLLTTPNRLRFYMLHKNLAAALTRRRFVSGFTHEHPREYSLKELASILENTGFRMERAEYIAFSPYLGIPFRLYRLLDDFSNRFLKKLLKWDVIFVARKS